MTNVIHQSLEELAKLARTNPQTLHDGCEEEFEEEYRQGMNSLRSWAQRCLREFGPLPKYQDGEDPPDWDSDIDHHWKNFAHHMVSHLVETGEAKNLISLLNTYPTYQKVTGWA